MPKFEKPSSYDLKRLRTIADFQFGKAAGSIVFPDEIMIEKSKGTKRIRFIYFQNQRIFSFRVRDGYLVPSILGAQILFKNNLGYKIKVDDEAEPFVRNGKTVFAKIFSGS